MLVAAAAVAPLCPLIYFPFLVYPQVACPLDRSDKEGGQ